MPSRRGGRAPPCSAAYPGDLRSSRSSTAPSEPGDAARIELDGLGVGRQAECLEERPDFRFGRLGPVADGIGDEEMGDPPGCAPGRTPAPHRRPCCAPPARTAPVPGRRRPRLTSSACASIEYWPFLWAPPTSCVPGDRGPPRAVYSTGGRAAPSQWLVLPASEWTKTIASPLPPSSTVELPTGPAIGRLFGPPPCGRLSEPRGAAAS